MNHGFIEAGAASPRLIDQIGGDPVPHKVRRPAFAAVRRRFQTRCRMTRSVHHNDRWCLLLLTGRYLELDIHLSNCDLVRRRGCIRSVRRRNRGVIRDFWNATDEEAALIVDDQRLRQKFLCLAAILRQHRHRHRDQKYRGKQTPTGTLHKTTLSPHGFLLISLSGTWRDYIRRQERASNSTRLQRLIGGKSNPQTNRVQR